MTVQNRQQYVEQYCRRRYLSAGMCASVRALRRGLLRVSAHGCRGKREHTLAVVVGSSSSGNSISNGLLVGIVELFALLQLLSFLVLLLFLMCCWWCC